MLFNVSTGVCLVIQVSLQVKLYQTKAGLADGAVPQQLTEAAKASWQPHWVTSDELAQTARTRMGWGSCCKKGQNPVFSCSTVKGNEIRPLHSVAIHGALKLNIILRGHNQAIKKERHAAASVPFCLVKNRHLKQAKETTRSITVLAFYFLLFSVSFI